MKFEAVWMGNKVSIKTTLRHAANTNCTQVHVSVIDVYGD